MDVHDVDLGLFDEPDGPALAPLVERAWPEGLSSADARAIAGLSRNAHRKLRRRLASLLDAEDRERAGDDAVGVPHAAASAGLGVSQFHLLARRWRAGDRSVAALGLHTGPRRSAASETDGGVDGPRASRERLAAAALSLLIDDPDRSDREVRRLLSEGAAAGASPLSVRRALESARRRAPAACFGRRIVFDAAGLDLVDPEGERLRLFAAVDADALILLTWVIATESSKAMGFVWAALLASENVPDGLASAAPCEGGTVLDVRFDPIDADGREVFEASLAIVPPPTSSYERLPGKVVVQALGERLGRVWLGTGTRPAGVGYRTGRAEHIPIVTVPIASGIDDAIAAHNARRLAVLRAGVPGADAGTMRLRRLASMFEEIGALEPKLLSLPSYGSRSDRPVDRSARTTS